MKCSTIQLLQVAAAMTGLSLAQGSLLSSSSPQKQLRDDEEPPRTKYVGAVVTVDHVKHGKGGDWDPDVISTAFLEADHEVHPHEEFQVGSAFLESVLEIPQSDPTDYCRDGLASSGAANLNDSVGNLGGVEYDYHDGEEAFCLFGEFLTLWLEECGGMRGPAAAAAANDDDKNGFFVNYVRSRAGKHRELEEALCDKLKQSGERAFSEISSCTIDFIFADDDTVHAETMLAARAVDTSKVAYWDCGGGAANIVDEEDAARIE